MKYVVSDALEADMKTLKRMFAEAGFEINTPAARYVRCEGDFIATTRAGNEAVMVRVGKNRIEIRRYNKNAETGRIISKYRAQAKEQTHRIRLRHRLPKLEAGVSWAKFIATDEQEDFARTFKTPPYRW